jgi:hypothetical protein
MTAPSLFRSLYRFFSAGTGPAKGGSPPCHARRRSPPGRPRLEVEPLEGRLCPTTIPVSITDPAGLPLQLPGIFHRGQFIQFVVTVNSTDATENTEFGTEPENLTITSSTGDLNVQINVSQTLVFGYRVPQNGVTFTVDSSDGDEIGALIYSFGGGGPHHPPAHHAPSGLQITGSPADVQAFRALLAQASGQSPHFAQLLQDIQASGAQIPVNLFNGPHPFDVFDNFASHRVFLNDIRQLPAAAPPGSAAITQGQVLAHFLEERLDAAVNHDPFVIAHLHGIAEENLFRQDTGQPPITNTFYHAPSQTYTVFFNDGSEEQILWNGHGNLTGIQFLPGH